MLFRLARLGPAGEAGRGGGRAVASDWTLARGPTLDMLRGLEPGPDWLRPPSATWSGTPPACWTAPVLDHGESMIPTVIRHLEDAESTLNWLGDHDAPLPSTPEVPSDQRPLLEDALAHMEDIQIGFSTAAWARLAKGVADLRKATTSGDPTTILVLLRAIPAELTRSFIRPTACAAWAPRPPSGPTPRSTRPSSSGVCDRSPGRSEKPRGALGGEADRDLGTEPTVEGPTSIPRLALGLRSRDGSRPSGPIPGLAGCVG